MRQHINKEMTGWQDALMIHQSHLGRTATFLLKFTSLLKNNPPPPSSPLHSSFMTWEKFNKLKEVGKGISKLQTSYETLIWVHLYLRQQHKAHYHNSINLLFVGRVWNTIVRIKREKTISTHPNTHSPIYKYTHI